jgi:hypothetical protein
MGENPKTRSHKLASSGIHVSAAGLGAFLGPVLGPEAGAATAEAVAQIGDELIQRLESRQGTRAARVLQRVHDEVERRKALGESVRDELADPGNPGSVALFEEVVEAAAKDSDERKGIVIGNLYASIVFDPEVSIDDALLFVRRVRVASGDSWWPSASTRIGSTELNEAPPRRTTPHSMAHRAYIQSSGPNLPSYHGRSNSSGTGGRNRMAPERASRAPRVRSEASESRAAPWVSMQPPLANL